MARLTSTCKWCGSTRIIVTLLPFLVTGCEHCDSVCTIGIDHCGLCRRAHTTRDHR